MLFRSISYDSQRLVNILVDKIKSFDFDTFELEADPRDEIDIVALKESIERELIEPSIDMNDPTGNTIVSGQTGITLAISDEELKSMILDSSSEFLNIPLNVTKPKYTDAQYKSMLFRDVLSSQSTPFNGNLTSRTANIRIAAKDCERVQIGRAHV